MEVFYASDENYVRHAAASMVSLMDHNRKADTIHIHMLSMGITDESRNALEKLCTDYGRRFTIHELGDIKSWFGFDFDTKGFSTSAMARLLIARIVPEDIDRILYLDCDTVVTGSLEQLWATDLSDCYLGMVVEPTISKKRRA